MNARALLSRRNSLSQELEKGESQRKTSSEVVSDDESSSWSDEDLPQQRVSEIHVTSPFRHNSSPKLKISTKQKLSNNEKQPSQVDDIPKQKLTKFLSFDAKLLHFVNLNKFYVEKINSSTEKFHTRMCNNMQRYYSSPVVKSAHQISEGFYCAVLSDGIWRRGIVKSMANEEVSVYLPDIGNTVTTIKGNIKLLTNKFKEPAAAAILCCLADIRPKQEYQMKYPEKASIEFKKLTSSTGFTMRVLLKEVAPNGHPNPAVVYVLPGNGLRLNLNAMLVIRMDCAESQGDDSREMIEIDPDSKRITEIPQKQRRPKKKTNVTVTMLHIVSPNEFYASLKHQKNEMDKLHLDIQRVGSIQQKYHELHGFNRKHVLNAGDQCLVLHSIKNKQAEWFRAYIINQTETSAFNVFLIDKGIQVAVEAEKIVDIMPGHQTTPPAALRMHIPGAAPPASNWPISSLELFSQVIKCFESLSISIVGDKDENGSLPVILWGVVFEKTPFQTQSHLHNIANHVYLEGYMDNSNVDYQALVEDKKPITEKDFGWTETADKSILSDDLSLVTISDEAAGPAEMTFGQITIDSTPHSINAWKSPLLEEKFIGIPTNVDDEGIIYIHNATQKHDLEDLKIMITRIYSKLPKDKYENIVKIGQPVIIFNVFDLCYYRAQIEYLNDKGLYKVKLVDYGTIEWVKRENIFTKVVAENFPILTKMYRLGSVVPLKENENEWPLTTLDFIHCEIVEKNAEITVMVGLDSVNECSIKVLNDQIPGKSIEELLIEKQLAKRREQDDVWPPKKKINREQEAKLKREEIKRYYQEVEDKKYEDLIKNFVKPSIEYKSPEETKKYLKKHEENQNFDSFQSVMSNAGRSFRRRTVPAPAINKENEFKYSLKEKYSQPPRLKPNIEFFDLQLADIKKFKCRFVNIVDEKIYLRPEIPEMKKRKLEMEELISEIDINYLIPFTRPQKAATKLCLANNGNGWKRGYVIKALDEGKKLEIFLVDKAKIEVFEIDQVRKMPVNLRRIPNQTLAVALHGLTLNPKVPEPEIAYLQLKHVLGNRTLTAIVKDYDHKDYPLVEICGQDGTLAYQKLIEKKAFIKT